MLMEIKSSSIRILQSDFRIQSIQCLKDIMLHSTSLEEKIAILDPSLMH